MQRTTYHIHNEGAETERMGDRGEADTHGEKWTMHMYLFLSAICWETTFEHSATKDRAIFASIPTLYVRLCFNNKIYCLKKKEYSAWLTKHK